MSSSTTHVCFITPYIEAYLKPGSDPHVGGAQRQQHLLARHLQDEGHAVSFIAFETDGRSYERIDGFDVWKTLPRTNDPIRTPEVLVALLRSLKRVSADVFYVRGNPPLCILTSYCCAFLREPLVYVVANDSNLELARLSSHHPAFRYTLPKLLYLDAVRRADGVVAQTGYQRDLLRDIFGIPSTVIPNGYTLPAADEIVPPDDRNAVLWVGSLDPDQKRPDRFLKLAQRLPEVHFRMVGWSDDTRYRAGIERRAKDLPNVSFEGFVPPDQIDRYYRYAVALVNTSAYEGFPNTFLEAWRYGVPVVSLEYSLDGVLTDEGVGYHAGTMDNLERTIAELWNDREQVADTGQRGREYVQTHYTMDAIYEKYADVFAKAIA